MTQKAPKKPRPYKGVSDEIREQTQKMKNMTFKQKISYFWTYFKVHTAVAILIIAVVSSFLHHIITSKDSAFYGIMLNNYMLDRTSMETAFSEYAGIDTETYDCLIDTDSSFSYQSMSEYDIATNQQIVALVQAKELDSFVLNDQVFFNFAFNEMMLDLREVYTEEELAKYEGNIYYIDNAEIEAASLDEMNYEKIMEESAMRRSATTEEILAEAETHRNPDTMKEPVPVGIYIEDSPFIQKTNSYPGRVPIFGISVTSQRIDTAKQYLYFLFDEEIPFEEMIADSIF